MNCAKNRIISGIHFSKLNDGSERTLTKQARVLPLHRLTVGAKV
ncbi:hypothetical protein MS6_2162 [Vibrio cholerae MS6]|nr:hypothetical protein MS6_2162 [Vibrio cholerae MS6]